jgi:hypothetical protein
VSRASTYLSRIKERRARIEGKRLTALVCLESG